MAPYQKGALMSKMNYLHIYLHIIIMLCSMDLYKPII